MTFNQAICALRAVNIINDLDLMNGRGDKLVVKTGSKESLAIRSVQQTESEATASLTEGHSLEDVYGPIRSAIERILQPVVAEKTEEQKKESAEVVTKALNSEGNAEDTLLQRPVSYYESLLAMNASHADKAVNSELSTKGQPIYEPTPREAGEAAERDDDGPVPEQFLQSEIERFRQRQAIREKEIAETKKNRVLARLRQLEAAQRDQQREAAEGVTIAKPKPPPHPPSSSNKRPLDGEDELEAKRQRKLQVRFYYLSSVLFCLLLLHGASIRVALLTSTMSDSVLWLANIPLWAELLHLFLESELALRSNSHVGAVRIFSILHSSFNFFRSI